MYISKGSLVEEHPYGSFGHHEGSHWSQSDKIDEKPYHQRWGAMDKKICDTEVSFVKHLQKLYEA